MKNENFKITPKRELPPYDAKGATEFVKKFVSLLIANSHWLVFVHQDAAALFNELQVALKAQFESCDMPNMPNVSMRYYPKSGLNAEMLLSLIRAEFPNATISSDPSQVCIICMAWARESLKKLEDSAETLLKIAEDERERPGKGFQRIEEAFNQIARMIERARSADLN